ncbi:monovalent cation:proton antiporter family protein [Marinisporobacter balticus]|uniref:Transporter (CPA2 family) n=1 Tax=Marinisporobacter balticus TaxID=2018667 RepID=A0A4R2KQI7_9FIRM|nr:cation:proton antiporter [Marinisporobacter balticus]TCO74947.1 transporter (CPA2 family) [Marinisporobacter balticus]
MDHSTISYNSLLIIILLATFVPFIIKKMKWLPIPIVVGEVIAGMIIGKSGFNLIEETAWLNFLYTFGFAFLMFLSGLEIDFNLIKSTGKTSQEKWYKKPFTLASFLFMGTLFLAYSIAYILKQFHFIANIPLITLIFSTTSLGIVVPTLKEKNLLHGAYGQIILLAALIADFATMVLVTVYISLYTSAAGYKVFLVLLLFIAFFVFYKMGLKIAGKKIIEDLSHATSQIKVRGAFSLILIFIALAQSLGTEIILGTFLAGLIVSLLDEGDHSDLSVKLDAIGYGFFIPIFFIMVGANFDIRSVINNPKSIYLLPALLVAVYAVKIIPAFILKMKFSLKASLSAGFLLSSRLSLIIATSAIGLKLNIISKETNGTIILVAILTCTVSPLLFNKLSAASPSRKNNSVYMIGVKQKTLLLAKRLQHSGADISFITHNPEKYEKTRKQNYNVYLGDTLDIDFLQKTGIQDAKTVVIYKTTDDISTEICRICRDVLGIENLLLLTNNQENLLKENKYGATVISPEFATVFMAENLILHPKAFSLLFEEEENDFCMCEIHLKNPNYFDYPIRSLKLPGDCLILSILREGVKIIPHGNNILRSGDLIMLVGSKEHVKDAELLFENLQ